MTTHDWSDYDSERFERILVATAGHYIPCEYKYIDRKTRKVAGYWAYGWFELDSFSEGYQHG